MSGEGTSVGNQSFVFWTRLYDCLTQSVWSPDQADGSGSVLAATEASEKNVVGNRKELGQEFMGVRWALFPRLTWSSFEEVLHRRIAHVEYVRRHSRFKEKQSLVAGEDVNEREAVAEGERCSAGAGSDFGRSFWRSGWKSIILKGWMLNYAGAYSKDRTGNFLKMFWEGRWLQQFVDVGSGLTGCWVSRRSIQGRKWRAE